VNVQQDRASSSRTSQPTRRESMFGWQTALKQNL
jgi:hypothetical protein